MAVIQSFLWNSSISKKENIYFLLMMILAFVQSFKREITPIVLVIFVLYTLFAGPRKNVFKEFKRPSLLFLSLFGIYFLYLVGALFTEMPEVGLLDLERKLTLLIFPLIMWSSYDISKEHLHKVIWSFVIGLFISSLICFYQGLDLYLGGQKNALFYSRLSYFMHPSFYALYVTFAIGYLGMQIFKVQRWKRFALVVLLIWFSIMVILLQSKLAYITYILVLVFSLGYNAMVMKRIKESVLMIVFAFGIAYGSLQVFPFLTWRVEKMMVALVGEGSYKNSSTNIRLNMIDISMGLWKEKPLFGYGLGTEQVALNAEYERLDMQKSLKMNMNTHSNYLQMLVTFGLIGFLVFVFTTLTPLWYSVQAKDHFYLFFTMMMTVAFVLEVILNLQVGVVFYSFFNVIFAKYLLQNRKVNA